MNDIQKLREEIDKIDSRIIENLSLRKKICLEIARGKKLANLEIEDTEREIDVIENIKKLARKYGTSEKFALSLYKLIIKNSKEEQKNAIV